MVLGGRATNAQHWQSAFYCFLGVVAIFADHVTYSCVPQNLTQPCILFWWAWHVGQNSKKCVTKFRNFGRHFRVSTPSKIFWYSLMLEPQWTPNSRRPRKSQHKTTSKRLRRKNDDLKFWTDRANKIKFMAAWALNEPEVATKKLFRAQCSSMRKKEFPCPTHEAHQY